METETIYDKAGAKAVLPDDVKGLITGGDLSVYRSIDNTKVFLVRDYGWGSVTVVEYEPVKRTGVVTNCYCCTCDEDEYGISTDPYCRNHGWAATRPCENHRQEGQTDDDGIMPESVQAYRQRKLGVKQ